MSAKIPLPPSEITPDNLVEIYELFCEAYEIKKSKRDSSFMKIQGLNRLRSVFALDYRPHIGGKFFGRGNRNATQFHGYSEPEDPRQDAKFSKFEELVLKYSSEKLG